MDLNSTAIGVLGLGYVGLPLAVEFGKLFPTIGFDIDSTRIEALKSGVDQTLELDRTQLSAATQLSFTADPRELRQCTVYMVSVPTPIDAFRRPDLGPLVNACRIIGASLTPGNVVVFESTVYPGCTEEVCVPILQEVSGLAYNVDFFVGYSPERINPGDHEHPLTSVVKVTSGSSAQAADFVDALYQRVVTAGTHRVSSIRVAEAAKVIENTQRDLNIALVNELALIFERLGIDTLEVLEAAGTKWNFLPFRPGLVGGHCIGVDPYYLTHKAQEVGYHPDVILSGRRINDNMGHWVADRVLRLMAERGINPVGAQVLVMGLSFKENCPDLRNTRVVDVIDSLKRFKVCVSVYDPWVDPATAAAELQLQILPTLSPAVFDAVIVCVAHRQFAAMGIDAIRALGKPTHVLFDVKGLFPRDMVDGRI